MTPLSVPRRPQYQTVAQREAYSGPSLRSPKVSLTHRWTGLSRDSQDRGLHTQARRVAGPRPPHMSAGHGAPLQCCMEDSHQPAYVTPWPPPSALGALPSAEGLLYVLWLRLLTGQLFQQVTLTCRDPNSPNGFSLGPFSVSSCLSRILPAWQL